MIKELRGLSGTDYRTSNLINIARFPLAAIILLMFNGCRAEESTHQMIEPPVGKLTSQQMVASFFSSTNTYEIIQPWDDARKPSNPNTFQMVVRPLHYQLNSVIVLAIKAGVTEVTQKAFDELQNAASDGRLIPEQKVDFGLTMFTTGPASFRKYFIGDRSTSLSCTYEGIDTPYPFVKCTWITGDISIFVETSPDAISYVLSNMSSIENFANMKIGGN